MVCVCVNVECQSFSFTSYVGIIEKKYLYHHLTRTYAQCGSIVHWSKHISRILIKLEHAYVQNRFGIRLDYLIKTHFQI